MKSLLMIGLVAATLLACGDRTATRDNRTGASANTPVVAPAGAVESPLPTPVIPKDGNYPARGKVTRINAKNGSIELDHEDIPGVMPARGMEFNVNDKAMLNGLKVDDTVDFTLEYKHPTETIVAIKKAP